MIERLKTKHSFDVTDFTKSVIDPYKDFYITKDKNRLFLTDIKFVEKVLKNQEIYGIFTDRLTGLLMIYREKGFRPYLKLLVANKDASYGLIKFLMWNFSHVDLYTKLKKENPLSRYLQKYGFQFQGDRGQEILLFRKGQKILHKVGAKDNEYNNENQRPY